MVPFKEVSMSKLTTFIKNRNMDEIFTMNFLQNAGVISDNAILAEDVYDGDFPKCKLAIVNLLARSSAPYLVSKT